MRLEVNAVPAGAPDATLRFRVLLLNDGFTSAEIRRNALIGPNLQRDGELPAPLSVEPTYGAAEDPIVLQPFAFYGRDRFFDGLEDADYVVSAEYVSGADSLTARLVVRGPGRGPAGGSLGGGR